MLERQCRAAALDVLGIVLWLDGWAIKLSHHGCAGQGLLTWAAPLSFAFFPLHQP